ncbi:MAG: DUF4136 domain-containing protein [Nitrospira sp.]
MNRVSHLATVCAALWVCVGCAQSVTVNVSGTSKSPEPIPQHVTYAVLPTNEVEHDRAFPDYAQLVSQHMEARGYKKTTDKTAHLGVYLAYGSTAVTTTATTSSAPLPPMNTGSGMSPSGSGGGSYGMSTGTPSTSTNAPQFKHQLVIVVLDLLKSRAAGTAAELWRGETMNSSHSNDFTRLAPLMVDAAFQHFGETTPSSVSHHFTEEESQKLQGTQ